MNGLILHVDARRVSLEDLKEVPMPEAMGPRHAPIRPVTWVKALQRAATAYDFQVQRLELGANQKKTRLFGVMDLQLPEEYHADRGLTLGFRYSTDQSISNGLVGGNRVFVCDNLALSGDMVLLNKKSTTNLSLVSAFEEGLENFNISRRLFEETIQRSQEKLLSKTLSEALLWQLFSNQVLPKKLMGPVEETWRSKPEGSGVLGESLWDLHNAGTFALKTEDSVCRWERSNRLGAFLAQAVNA